MGRRFNEELMNLRRIPKLTVKESMRQWRENRGLVDSKTDTNSEGSSIADTGNGGSSDSPIQDGEKPVGGSDRLAVRAKRNPKRGKVKNKGTS